MLIKCNGILKEKDGASLVCNNPSCGRVIKEDAKEYDKRMVGVFCGNLIARD